MRSDRLAWAQIHFCVFLWGFTAIFGRLITLPALQLVWWRVTLVAVVLLCVPQILRRIRRMPWRLIAAFAGVGVLVALHWVTFYLAIKLANASVAVTCIALAPVFLALVEPRIAGRAFDFRELSLGIIAVPGVALVVGGTPPEMRLGIPIGILSMMLVAVFASLNKRMIQRADPLTVTAIEMTSGMVFLSLVCPIAASAPAFVLPGSRDFAYLLILAMGCTLLPFALSLVALRHLTAFGTALAVNLEPVYAIGLAILLLGEQHELNASFYIGVTLILSAVFAYPLLHRQRDPVAQSDGGYNV